MNTKYYRLEMNNDTKEVSAFDVTNDIENLKERANKLAIDDDLVAAYINTTENPYSVLAKVENEYLVTYCKDNNELHKYVLEHTTAREMLESIDTDYIARYLANADPYNTNRILDGIGKDNILNYARETYGTYEILEDLDTDDILNQLCDSDIIDYAVSNNYVSDVLNEMDSDDILDYVSDCIDSKRLFDKLGGNEIVLEHLIENDPSLISKIKDNLDMSSFLDSFAIWEIVEYLKGRCDISDVVNWNVGC